MSHTAPKTHPFEVKDIDDNQDSISVAMAYDGTIEFMVKDHNNSGNYSFSSMSTDDAVKFANAIIEAVNS